uniref:CSON007987 protein n=1 Tax=Culicoides sonorensis TaxID=179676 RepID=A0A336KDP5_CULSO
MKFMYHEQFCGSYEHKSFKLTISIIPSTFITFKTHKLQSRSSSNTLEFFFLFTFDVKFWSIMHLFDLIQLLLTHKNNTKRDCLTFKSSYFFRGKFQLSGSGPIQN